MLPRVRSPSGSGWCQQGRQWIITHVISADETETTQITPQADRLESNGLPHRDRSAPWQQPCRFESGVLLGAEVCPGRAGALELRKFQTACPPLHDLADLSTPQNRTQPACSQMLALHARSTREISLVFSGIAEANILVQVVMPMKSDLLYILTSYPNLQLQENIIVVRAEGRGDGSMERSLRSSWRPSHALLSWPPSWTSIPPSWRTAATRCWCL